MELTDSVKLLPQVSDRYAKVLAKLNILTIRDLLTHFPRYHKDTSEISTIDQITEPGEYTIQAFVKSFRSIRLRGGRTMQRGILVDESGEIEALWFNQPFLVQTLKPDLEFMFLGKAHLNKQNQLQFSPNVYEPIIEGRELTHIGRITPQYSLTEGLGIKWLRNRIKYLIDHIAEITDIEQTELRPYLKEDFKHALMTIHFPENEVEFATAEDDLEILELTELQLKVIEKLQNTPQKKGVAMPVDFIHVADFISKLSFQLTVDQLTVIKEILLDLGQDKPMDRLLQGDVGSGKTIVAIVAALATQIAGFQTIILAPTTVLANQHFQSFSKILADTNVSIELVTGEKRNSKPADIIIGTSAVLARQSDILTKVGLVIVDEQHRFGVAQREELLKPFDLSDQKYPHFLNMTATPIPRTLTMALFSDMQISTITTKPIGRLPIKTHIVEESKRAASYTWIREEIKRGAQVYWVCPLIDESENLEIKSALSIYEHLTKEVFPDIEVALLHGRMKPAEKTAIMEKFVNGFTPILVSTSVIEVGIDAPKATIMIIEGAERFGLAQLHQIRGRVGRSNLQSWCFLYPTEDSSQKATERLEFFAEHHNGIEIAEYDLHSRGPGEVYGSKQSGIPNLKIASLDSIENIKRSRDIAWELYNSGTKHINLFA